MFEVSVEKSFAAGHALRGYKGKCENVHGHNYKIRVTLNGERLDSIGLLCDFVEVKRLMQAIIDRLELQRGLAEAPTEAPVRVGAVTVWETDVTAATYYE
jgi:6-pyruvoyltetrahydropterin/6-carboxytetrahydropterin synthase